MKNGMNCYQVLGITGDLNNLTEEILKKRYKELMKLRHPDMGGNSEAAALTTEAYEEALGNLNKRVVFEKRPTGGKKNSGNFDENIWRNVKNSSKSMNKTKEKILVNVLEFDKLLKNGSCECDIGNRRCVIFKKDIGNYDIRLRACVNIVCYYHDSACGTGDVKKSFNYDYKNRFEVVTNVNIYPERDMEEVETSIQFIGDQCVKDIKGIKLIDGTNKINVKLDSGMNIDLVIAVTHFSEKE